MGAYKRQCIHPNSAGTGQGNKQMETVNPMMTVSPHQHRFQPQSRQSPRVPPDLMKQHDAVEKYGAVRPSSQDLHPAVLSVSAQAVDS